MKVKEFKVKVCLRTGKTEEVEGEFANVRGAQYSSHWRVPGYALAEIRRSEQWIELDLFHPETKTGEHIDVVVFVDRWGRVTLRRYGGWRKFQLSDQELLNQLWPTGQYCLRGVILALAEKFPRLFYCQPQFG